jgi:hypothetical protein
MDPQDIADAALGDDGESPPPSSRGAGGRADPELVALVKRFGRALEARDWEAAAKAFGDAVEAADVDDTG